MARIIVTAEVHDAKKWEEGFRSKAKLFDKMARPRRRTARRRRNGRV